MSDHSGNHIKKARTGGARPGSWWPCQLLLAAAAVALANAPQLTQASTSLWNVTGCPALDPYTAGAPTNASLTITVENVPTFDQRGGSSCVIAGAVTLVFKIEAMRAVAVAAGLPNVSIAVQDIVMRTLGGAVPTIQVYVVTNPSAPVVGALPIDLSIQNISASIETCAIEDLPLEFLTFQFASNFPPRSTVVINDVHLFSPTCYRNASIHTRPRVVEIYAVRMSSLILRSGMDVTISNVSVVHEHLSYDSMLLGIISGSIYTDTDAAGGDTFTISDVLVAVLGGNVLEDADADVYLRTITVDNVELRKDVKMVILNPRALARNIRGVSGIRATLFYTPGLNLYDGSRFIMQGGDILVDNNTVSRSYAATIQVEGIATRPNLADNASFSVDIGRIIVASCSVTGQWSTLVVAGLQMSQGIHAASSATVTITGHLSTPPTPQWPWQQFALPPDHTSEAFGGILSGVHVLGVQVTGNANTALRATAVDGSFTLRDQTTMSVEGLVVRVDGAFLNSTSTNPAQPSVSAALLTSWVMGLEGADSRFTLRRGRVEVVRVVAGTITAGAITASNIVTIIGAVTVSEVAQVVAKSTVRGLDGVQAHVFWGKQGIKVQGASAVLTVNNTCQLVEKMLPNNANITTSVIRPVSGQASALTLTSGGRYVEGVTNSTLCYPRRTVTATIFATRTGTHSANMTTSNTKPPLTKTTTHAATRTVDMARTRTSDGESKSKTKTSMPPTPTASKTPTPRPIEIQETAPPTTSPAPTKPAAGQRGDVTGATTNTLADRPGPLAAVIVCSLIGLVVVVVAIVVWRRRQGSNFLNGDNNHAAKDAAKDGVARKNTGNMNGVDNQNAKDAAEEADDDGAMQEDRVE